MMLSIISSNISILYLLHVLGDISIHDGVALSMNTLTCISTGGPATTVTWTRDSVTITEGTETVLNDPVTAQYTHTLNVTSGGEYTCTVSNDKPSTASATITVPGINGYLLELNNHNMSPLSYLYSISQSEWCCHT